jgi:TPR repeat protein
MNNIRLVCIAIILGLLLSACGNGTQQDKAESAALSAAQQYYYKGEFKKAAPLFQALAERGNVQAEFFLGGMYLSGTGVPQDYAQALKWSSAAAKRGSTAAQFNLGKMYEQGLGVPQDNVQAHMWYSLSASSGDEQATRQRDEVAHKMTYDQIQEARKRAKAWLEAHNN